MMRSSAAAGRVARLAEQLAPAPAASGAPSVLIVGASRGIGLGLVQAYAASGWEVHATTRTLDSPGELGSVAGDVTLCVHSRVVRYSQNY
jgi:D-arabinose 1-dehydrogenase-like Zn-dependent alcohol dehydrogenase